MALTQIDKTLNINFLFFFWLGENNKKFHTINDESEIGDVNENEVNEPPKYNIKIF